MLPLFLALLLLPLLPIFALPVNISRLTTHLTTLATHNDLSPPAVQRILYTPADISSRTYLKSLFRDVGLETREDPLGNIFATWRASEPGVLTGSHFDAIPNSGMYDGTLGILSALEAVTALKQSGFVPQRSITIIAFTSEEPTRFGLSCIGSRMLSGVLSPTNLTNLKDSSGIPFDVARTSAGYFGDLQTVPLSPGDYTAFIELHSEQGPLLENSSTQIGVVTSIAAPAALLITFRGPGGHAGTTLMNARKDPSLAAAELCLSVEAAVARYGGVDTVGTTGYIDIIPNAVNSVPTVAKVGVDVRDIFQQRRDRILTAIEGASRLIAKQRDVGVEIVYNSRDPPVKCDEQVVGTIVDIVRDYGFSFKKMVSRAYHDALFMAGVMPTGMIFVPCRGGISHRPDEFVAKPDLENGVRVLAGVLKRLAGDDNEGKVPEQPTEAAEVVEESGETVDGILASALEDTVNLEHSRSEGEGDDDEEVTESSAVEISENTKVGERDTRQYLDEDIPTTAQTKIKKSSEPEGTTLNKLTVTAADEEFDKTSHQSATYSNEPRVRDSKRPTIAGSRNSADTNSRNPRPADSREPVATNMKSPSVTELNEPSTRGPREEAAVGSEKREANGSKKRMPRNSRNPTRKDFSDPSSMGSKRPATNDSRKPMPTGSKRPAATLSKKPATRSKNKPASRRSRRRVTKGSQEPVAQGSRKPKVMSSRGPAGKASRKLKVSKAETGKIDQFPTEGVDDFEETIPETISYWHTEGFEVEEHSFGGEKDEV